MWAAVVLVSLVALGNARLLVRGVWERAAGASPAADVAWSSDVLAPWARRLPAGTVVGFVPESTDAALASVAFDKARLLLVPLRVVRSTHPQWVFVEARAGEANAEAVRAAGYSLYHSDPRGLRVLVRDAGAASLIARGDPVEEPDRREPSILRGLLALLAALIPWRVGAAVVRRGLTRADGDGPSRLTSEGLGLALGWGLAGAGLLAWRLAGGPADLRYTLADLAAWLVAAAALFVARAAAPLPRPRGAAEPWAARATVALAVVLGLLAAMSTAHVLLSARAAPWGFDDSIAMWNLKGRVLAEGGPHWRTWFEYDATASEDYCLAPDYPLVWSAVVARLWIACGAATPLAPLGASLAVLAAIVAATVGLVTERWGAASGLLAGLVILGTDLVLKLATSQAADLPLALWIVATLGCLGAAERDPSRAGSWMLAGVLGGLAAGLKNEGLVALGALVAAQTLVALRRQGGRAALRGLALLAAGAALPLAVVAWQKLGLRADTLLVREQQGQGWLESLSDPSRYATVAVQFARDGVRLTKLWPLVLPLIWLLERRRGGPPDHAAGAATGLVAGGLYFAVVFAVFVLTPFPLAGHLEATLRRLFVQGWPAAVVTWFWLTGPLGTPSGPRLPGPDESARLR